MIRFIFSLKRAAAIFDNFGFNFLPKRFQMQHPCQDIMPRTLTNDVKLKQMTSLIGLALHYFAHDVKLTAAASGFLKLSILFIHSLK